MARFRFQTGSGRIGKSKDESIRLLLRQTKLDGWKLIIEDFDDGTEVWVSPYCIPEIIAALTALDATLQQKRQEDWQKAAVADA